MSSGKLYIGGVGWEFYIDKEKKKSKNFDIETLPYHVQKQRFSRLY